MNSESKRSIELMAQEPPINKLAILFGHLLKDGYATAIDEEKIRAMKAWNADHQFAFTE